MYYKNVNDADSALQTYINSLDMIEEDIDIQQKYRVVVEYEKKLQVAVTGILKKMDIYPKLPQEFSICKLIIHGSTKLRMRLKTSDVDVVLVVPNYVSRNQWFTLLTECLTEDPLVTDVVSIIEAYVPVIKFSYENIQFDMVIGRIEELGIKTPLNFYSNSDHVPVLYTDLDSKSIFALSSIHIIQEIRNQTYKYKNVFSKFIRFIKIWTKRRQIDQYIFGFPSTIAWVILSLHTYLTIKNKCQNTYSISVQELFVEFFSSFKAWKWPKPVIVNNMDPDLKCLNHLKNEVHEMPIMSIVYPFKNTAYTVRKSTLSVIKDEFNRGDKILNLRDGSNPNHDLSIRKWEKLFQEINIHLDYIHFIQINLECGKDQFLKFQGLVAAKLREYAVHLEKHPSIKLARIHVPSNRFDGKRQTWIIGLKMHENKPFINERQRCQVNITPATKAFFQILQEKSPYTNFYKMLKIRYLRKKELGKL